MKILKEFARWIFFCAFAFFLASVLGVSRSWALYRLENRVELQMRASFSSVLPPFDNDPWKERFEIAGLEIYPAFRFRLYSGRKLTGFAVRVEGHASRPLLIGFSRRFDLHGAALLQAVPLLGSAPAAAEHELSAFKDLEIQELKEKVESGNLPERGTVLGLLARLEENLEALQKRWGMWKEPEPPAPWEIPE